LTVFISNHSLLGPDTQLTTDFPQLLVLRPVDIRHTNVASLSLVTAFSGELRQIRRSVLQLWYGSHQLSFFKILQHTTSYS